MKRKIFALFLCLVFALFAGCSGAEAPAPDGAPKAPPTEAPTQPPVTEPAVPAADRELLAKISGSVLENQAYAELYALGENLLLVSEGEVYDAATGSFGYGSYLTLLCPKDGSVLTTRRIDHLTGQWELCVAHDYVMTQNVLWGNIGDVLDSSLSPVEFDASLPEELPLTGHFGDGRCWGYWVSPDLRFLYVMYSVGFDASYDLLRVDLETDEVRTLLSDLVDANYTYKGAQYVLFNHYTPEDRVACSLDLYTGELEEAPVKAWLFDRIGDTWVMQDENDFNTFYIETSEGGKTVHFGESLDPEEVMHFHASENLSLLTEQHLFLKGEYGWSGTLYDVSGKFISHYEFPEPVGQDDMFYTVSTPVWSEADGGYYLLVNGAESCDLYFWDIRAEVDPLPDLN